MARKTIEALSSQPTGADRQERFRRRRRTQAAQERARLLAAPIHLVSLKYFGFKTRKRKIDPRTLGDQMEVELQIGQIADRSSSAIALLMGSPVSCSIHNHCPAGLTSRK
jgi:hypothetical protein